MMLSLLNLFIDCLVKEVVFFGLNFLVVLKNLVYEMFVFKERVERNMIDFVVE